MTHFRRADSAPDLGTLRAIRVLLPVLWWRDVPLTTTEPVELSPLDQFFIEAVDRRGRLDAREFTMFTGLPGRVFGGLARRLWNLGLVSLSDGIATSAEDGLRRVSAGTVVKTRTITQDLLFLPHTDDLIVVEGGLGDFERALPRLVTGRAPLPVGLAGLTRDGLLTARIAAGKVVNLPPQVQGPAMSSVDESVHAMAGDEGRALLPLVPAIECSITVDHRMDTPRAVLDVQMQGREAPVAVDLGSALGVIADLDAVEALLGTESAALRPLGLPYQTAGRLRRESPGRWSAAVTGDEARTLAGKGPLTAPVGIEIRASIDRVRLVTGIQLRAADSEAERLLALDAFIDTLLTDPANVTAQVMRHPPDDQAALRRRAWALGHYWIVHALREQEDFAYA
jgi:hypothetical protein